MTNADKTAYLQSQITSLEDEIWKLDANAKALARAGLSERAEAIAKQAAEAKMLIDAFKEQMVGL